MRQAPFRTPRKTSNDPLEERASRHRDSGEGFKLDKPLMRRDLLGKSDYRHLWVRLDFE
jgi:hypothetical protein